MFKPAYFLLATAAAASMLAVPLSAEEIVVSPPSQKAYVDEVSHDLDTRLARMRFEPWSAPTGIVKLRFRVGDDGSPVGITTYESSGNRRLDLAVKRAVAKLDTLLPLPAGAGMDPVVQANVIVAKNQVHKQQLAEQLAASEARRMASGDPVEGAVLALTVVPSASS